MGPFVFSANDYKLGTIPDRLYSLELCVLCCLFTVQQRTEIEGIPISPLGKIFDKDFENDSLSKAFIHSGIEQGILYNRVMLGFLGIKKDSGTLTAYSPSTSDVTLISFGQPLVTPADATGILPKIDAADLERCFLTTLTSASKAFAHLTKSGGQVKLCELAVASFALVRLLEKHFFAACGEPRPATIIPAEWEPTRAWLGFGPWLH